MNRKIWILFIIVFIILFSNVIFSSSNPFETPRRCSDVWGGELCNSTTLDDANFGGCNGTKEPSDSTYGPHILEVYINATNFFPEAGINVTCEFKEVAHLTNYKYFWYYNSSEWISIQNFTSNPDVTQTNNTSIIFNLNSSEGIHRIRCIISKDAETTGPCSNSTYTSATQYDNDDVIFTVTSHLTYDFWNLTNYTTGEEIASNQTFTRNDSINVSAKWNKNISFAQIEHNGTGTWTNYTISSLGNWTNYTLNLSNTSEFNNTIIAIRSIYVNDTYSATNNTYPELYFYLLAGNAPNVTNFWFSYNGTTTNITNKYTNLTIHANVSDDVGLSTVKANITYPDGNSTNATMQGDTSSGWQTWNYTFGNDLHLNSTGNYTVRIYAIDIGDQEKASGIDYDLENMSFNVTNNYTLNLTSNYTLYMRGENITIEALEINNFVVENVNWTVNITKYDGTISNFTPQVATFNYTVLPDDPVGNYSMIANTTKDNNTGNSSWNFNVSRSYTITITTDPSSSPGKYAWVTVSAALYNARGELYTNSVNATVSCDTGSTYNSLNFSSGQATYLCRSPNSYSTPFTITVNVSDSYNNTGENSKTLTTESAPSTGGGGGVFTTTTTIKNCSDNTSYNQCSSNKPYYCLNGTLIKNCSVCGCTPDYRCQIDGSCILIKEEDFNFTIDATEIEIEQGKDSEIKGRLINTGNTALNLVTFLNASDCCNVTLPLTFSLKEKEEREFAISIHVPLFTGTNKYSIKIAVGTSSLKKEKIIDVIVTKSSFYYDLSEIETALSNLENQIQNFKKAGVDTQNLESSIEKSKSIFSDLNSSISSDQINVLSDSIKELKNNINFIQTSLNMLIIQGIFANYSWLIILLIAMIILTLYFVPEVFIPLNQIEKQMKKLKDDEKNLISSRVETEKQYFMRKIDENTFTKIMITKQDNILKLRATINEKEKDRKTILLRMYPKEIIKWFVKSIKNLPKNTKNLLMKALKKIKKPNFNIKEKVKIFNMKK